MSEEKISCYDVVKEFVRDLEKRTSEAIDTATEPEAQTRILKRISEEIQLSLMEAGELRFLLNNQEKRMRGLVDGINKILRELGEKPESVFCHPKLKDDQEVTTIKCPHCGKENKDFVWGWFCKYCREVIHSPWRESVQCPKCHFRVLREDIFDEQSGHELKDGFITCVECDDRFNWKENVLEPRVYGLKTCINCNMYFTPAKNNWKKQIICPDCKGKGIDSFKLNNPGYQEEYRKEKKKENREKATRK